MTNIQKLRKAISDASVERNKFMRIARDARIAGNQFKADMAIMDADFADEDRRKFAGKLLDVTTRQHEIEAFEDRRGVDIDVMLYDIPATGSIDDWWDFIHDDTEVITNPSWTTST